MKIHINFTSVMQALFPVPGVCVKRGSTENYLKLNHFNLSKWFQYCIVLGNIHTHLKKGHWNSEGKKGSRAQNFQKKV